ncbi:Glycosyltransferase involved in cell wall bisynthesis [Cohnella sp. OV330]|uniref:glycosyltransferase family 4 protein n=1 Tax=Cohnella sp. OV330 TaxID=1855288 RepID=UPI0008EB2C6C|nr:glycosyltransferase family 4 protein [Cohnella sp. OV330]SFB30024.1 Glycosyltransferase involved in cell wall bisynthesis [Cohnella sp. OV330]
MPGKVLFCATVDYHFRAFHLPIMEWFKQQGWEVHVAAQGKLELPFVDRKFNIPIERSPLHKANFTAYRQLRSIMQEQRYDIVHCHTPMGGVIARMAGRSVRGKGTKVIYTAHGFHFCKGAPLPNWLVYYPIEKSLARFTDCLITINDEDYRLANQRQFKAGRIAKVHGVGIDTDMFHPLASSDRALRRQEFGYRTEQFMMFYAAEFNANKNHRILIEALARIKVRVPSIKLLLAGRGALETECRQLASALGVESMIDFLGYRDDISRLLPMCDLAVSGSLREGLPVNIMEAMACGLPIVATHNRGHSELVADQINGYLIDPRSVDDFVSRISQLATMDNLRHDMGAKSLERIKRYTLSRVKSELSEIYSSYMLQQSTSEADKRVWKAQ